MIQRLLVLTIGFVLLASPFALPRTAVALTAIGMVEPTTPLGQYMAMTMTIGESNTTFELTGPDFSWFAFGFEPNGTMMGYSLIIEGLDDNRTAVEQNLLGIGIPGIPQATQNINLFSTVHDSVNNLTTVTILRANNTGDANDPVFSPSMTSLDLIWAYSSTASPASPIPNLSFHGSNGRGFDTITFTQIPEPNGMVLAAFSAMALFALQRCLGKGVGGRACTA